MEPIVSTEWLKQHFEDPDLIILDASTKKNKAGLETDLENIQIKGSRFFDLEGTFNDRDSALPNTLPSPSAFQEECRRLGINNHSQLVVYDNLGIYTSPRVWWMFKVMGHDTISVLNGGLPKWVDQGFEVTTPQETDYQKGDFTATHQPQLFTNLDDMTSNLETKELLVVDARSAGRFAGTTPEPRKGLRGGHIPESVNLPFKDVLNDGEFRSASELTEVFDKLKLDDRPLAFTCGSGITACIILLASELVSEGQKSVFDGSWTEWALAEHLPVDSN